MRCAALISFMAALTFMSGSMSVTSVWMIMKPNEDIDFVSCSLTSCAISSLVCNAALKSLTVVWEASPVLYNLDSLAAMQAGDMAEGVSGRDGRIILP